MTYTWEDLQRGVILAIDKPLGMTSFQVVGKVRYELTHRWGHVSKELKVGHAGTLDPMATGVLVVCTGKCTKQIEQLQGHTKEYVAGVRLGATTPSYDRETIDEMDTGCPVSHLSRTLVEEKLKNFVGDILQTPPSFSAVKVNGKRAYKLARQGKEVTIQAKQIHVENIEIVETNLTDEVGVFSSCEPPYVTLRVVCGKGTYIRALARDLGEALGSGAFLTSLRRTRVGEIKVENCIPLSF